jgi:hypothetical protein
MTDNDKLKRIWKEAKHLTAEADENHGIYGLRI